MITCEEKFSQRCPVRYTLDLLGGKWKLPIIFALSQERKRFSVLERQIQGISPRMLVKELKELERHQLITRTVFAEVPPRVEYALTAAGSSIAPLLREINQWGTQHMATHQLL